MLRLTTIARLAASPAARGLLSNAARSATARELARQAVHDPRGLARQLADPGAAQVLLGRAIRDPAVREAARVGMVFVPIHYAVLGNAALWGARRVARRYRATFDGDPGWADPRKPPLKNVTPDTTTDRTEDGHPVRDPGR